MFCPAGISIGGNPAGPVPLMLTYPDYAYLSRTSLARLNRGHEDLRVNELADDFTSMFAAGVTVLPH